MTLRLVRNIASFAAFLTMLAVFFWYVASLGVRVEPPAKRVNLSLDVSDINNIVVDSNVMLRGVPVGKVTGIDTSVATASIHFYIDGKYRVPADSLVRLENLSALGESYIELEPRSSGGTPFREGQRIAPDSIKQPPSISELGTSVVRVLNQLDPRQLSDVVHEADTGLPDPNIVLPNLAHASLLLRNMTADFNGQGGQMLANFQTLLQNAGWVGPALARATDPTWDLGPAIHTMWNQGVMLVTGLRHVDVIKFSLFLQRLQHFLDEHGPDLRVLGVSTSENFKLIANALKNLDSSQILSNLLATVPENGVIQLHVANPHG